MTRSGSNGAGRARRTLVATLTLLSLATVLVVAPDAVRPSAAFAAPPPTPLLWQRQYVPPGGQVSNDEFANIIHPQCAEDQDRGTRSNGVSGPGVPKIAVVGDSTEVQTRRPAMADTAIRWEYATHCGEELASLVDEGRLFDALATNPDALVFGLGSNSLSYFWQVRPEQLDKAKADLHRMLDVSDGARCRVLVNLPRAAPPWVDGWPLAVWLWLTDQLNQAMVAEAAARQNVFVADWASRIAWYWPAYLQDGQHETPTGVNERLNLEIETARRCWAPDSPANVQASPVDRAATVWWDPLPAPEHVGAYRVTVSPGGKQVITAQPTVNIGGLTNGVAYSFRVEALSGVGFGAPSAWTAPVVPSAVGARFHASPPVRVLDTRTGAGGKATPFGPGERAQLSLGSIVPAGASSVVLNVTATGQTAETFVTVWPGHQSQPLTSNLNPRPGIDAVPALVTTRLAPDGTIQLFNNAGSVHLLADVVGWYGAPGDTTGALYTPVVPQRLLDTRDGTGGKATPFAGGETYSLPIGTLPGMPIGASAAVLNVTGTNVVAPTHVTVWPSGVARPQASSLNPQPGLTRANLTVSAIGADGKVSFFNNAGTTALVVDLVGYYTAPGAGTGGAAYFPLTPERAYDTRDGTGGVNGRLTGPLTLGFAGRGAVPVDASAVDLNATVVDEVGPGHLTVWPAGTSAPLASNINFGRSDVIANRVLTGLGAAGANAAPAGSATYLIVDVAGWFGPPM